MLRRPDVQELPAPQYVHRDGGKVALAVESMKRHTTDEGWQIMAGLEHAGYVLCGQRLPMRSADLTSVPRVLKLYDPAAVVVQDKREWDVDAKDFRDKSARFTGVEVLRERADVFKLTVLKDAHQRPHYHAASADEIGCHAWIVYYAPSIVAHLAPYVRPQHVVRTHHSVDSTAVPAFAANRDGQCLLSGAISGAYPMRQMLVRCRKLLPQMDYLAHPGYHMDGCATPAYLKLLSHYRVAVCTSSVYGYALRKIVEATACGCRVLTDLPADEVLPHVDGNLVRVDSSMPLKQLGGLMLRMCREYDASMQYRYAAAATAYYDYRAVGMRLDADIECMRRDYACST